LEQSAIQVSSKGKNIKKKATYIYLQSADLLAVLPVRAVYDEPCPLQKCIWSVFLDLFFGKENGHNVSMTSEMMSTS
jgi:hypothetical protein